MLLDKINRRTTEIEIENEVEQDAEKVDREEERSLILWAFKTFSSIHKKLKTLRCDALISSIFRKTLVDSYLIFTEREKVWEIKVGVEGRNFSSLYFSAELRCSSDYLVFFSPKKKSMNVEWAHFKLRRFDMQNVWL